MAFSSITFLIAFLPLTLLCYYSIPSLKAKNILLLVLSILFYSWGEPRTVLILIISILVNYKAGLFLSEERQNVLYKHRKYTLAISVSFNVLLLFYFKYIGFGARLLNELLNLFNLTNIPIKDWILPVGISFFTFRSISYLIETYSRPELVQKNILDLGLYIAFFPQLLAGPISRYDFLNEQIANRTFSTTGFTQGIERFIIGLAKKVLIADVLGEVVDGIFNLPFQSVSTYYTWIAALAYTLQIYYDFSGYSDMAIGVAKMLGFKTVENFNYPYISRSITEFWRRWHISLSTWFRDYLYIPLGGDRKGRYRTIANIIFVFLVTGLWHGASFSFILWGCGHGLMIAAERWFGKNTGTDMNPVSSFFSRLYTILVVVLLWVPFRVGTGDSVKIILKLFGINYSDFIVNGIAITNSPKLLLIVDIHFYIILLTGILLAFPWWRKVWPNVWQAMPESVAISLKYAVLLLLFTISFVNIAGSSYTPFIYFKF